MAQDHSFSKDSKISFGSCGRGLKLVRRLQEGVIVAGHRNEAILPTASGDCDRGFPMGRRHTTPIGEMWLEDGILWHRIDSETVSEEDARDVLQIVGEITGGRPAPAVVDMRSIGFASKEARQGFAGSPESSHEIATALVVSSSSSRIMAQAFLKLSKPDRPIGVFTDIAEARDWAGQYRPEA